MGNRKNFLWGIPFYFFAFLFASQGMGAETLALKPPMGWNSWNTFGCNINETIVRETAKAMVSSGMLKAGYRYLVIDDCWQARQRDANGNLQADPKKFPSGMRALGDYIHSLGLLFGIYTSVGKTTCQGFPGSYGHETQDAALFASWGADYLKDDFCGWQPDWIPNWIPINFWPWWNFQTHYRAMSDALTKTGRPIVFSICNWGFGEVWKWGKTIAQAWRTTMDIKPHWLRITQILDYENSLAAFAGPGGWNDADMLEVGVPPLTDTESETHFGLWAMLASPLFAGNDIRTMSSRTREILTNAEVIAVNQDPLGKQGYFVTSHALLAQVWAKPMSDCVAKRAGRTCKRSVAVLLNRFLHRVSITANFEKLGLKPGLAKVRDLLNHVDLGESLDLIRLSVPPKGIQMLELTQES